MAIPAGRTVWIDRMRSFITVLVVAHHAALAYTSFAWFDSSRYINSTNPVVDASRWVGLDVFVNFNDIFFMPLMFFISGLFVYKGIIKKGAGSFVKDRLMRLGIPFIVAEIFIIPLAYLPSYYLVHRHIDWSDFIHDYIVNQYWPVGPPWFIWLLLLFNMIAVVIPARWYAALFQATARLAKRPLLFLLMLFIVVSLTYTPLSIWVGPYTWTGWMPFDFQLNRFLLYLVFFLFGVCLGSGDWEPVLFKDNRLFNLNWAVWVFCSVSIYGILEVILFTWPLNSTARHLVFNCLFVISCIASSLACLAFFKWKIKSAGNFWNNLSGNAYGIYLVHYFMITWLQFALLSISVPVIVKFFIVFTGTLIASWLIINWIRKIAFFKKVL